MSQIVGVIGDPIEHSLSPVMHQAALRAARIDAVYCTFHVKESSLADFIQEVRRKDYRGFNVTIPHKRKIREFLDEMTPEAQAIGAVNTVCHHEGRLTGYNTDASGYLQSLREENQWEAQNKTITVLGAGGAARAVVYGLLQNGAQHIFVVNRTESKAVSLAADMDAFFTKKVTPLPWSELKTCLTQSDLLVNATSMGMDGAPFKPLPLEALSPGALVSDLVYTPRQTLLLEWAKERGYATHEGLGMLLYQGAEAFRIWFERDPDITVMRQALERALN